MPKLARMAGRTVLQVVREIAFYLMALGRGLIRGIALILCLLFLTSAILQPLIYHAWGFWKLAGTIPGSLACAFGCGWCFARHDNLMAFLAGRPVLFRQ